jgi:ABC-type antimicrobial peptide transport system permease subunit
MPETILSEEQYINMDHILTGFRVLEQWLSNLPCLHKLIPSALDLIIPILV